MVEIRRTLLLMGIRFFCFPLVFPLFFFGGIESPNYLLPGHSSRFFPRIFPRHIVISAHSPEGVLNLVSTFGCVRCVCMVMMKEHFVWVTVCIEQRGKGNSPDLGKTS